MSTVVHTYAKSPEQNYWQSLQALNVRSQLSAKSAPHSLTVSFVNSCRIFYEMSSSDPIFPAESKFRVGNLWHNDDDRAHPLACIDWIETCAAGNQGACLPPYQNDFDVDKHFVFARYALNRSTTFDSIFFRGATSLDAQNKISGDTSLPLATNPPQWILESWNLFNTSLARIQYDALEIATGAGIDLKNYVSKMPSQFKVDDMCGMFLFQIPKGYSNIHILFVLGVGLVLPCGLWLFAMEINTELSDGWKGRHWFGHSKLIAMEWPFRKLMGAKPGASDHTVDGTVPQQHNDPPPAGPSNYGSAAASHGSQASPRRPASPAAYSQILTPSNSPPRPGQQAASVPAAPQHPPPPTPPSLSDRAGLPSQQARLPMPPQTEPQPHRRPPPTVPSSESQQQSSASSSASPIPQQLTRDSHMPT